MKHGDCPLCEWISELSLEQLSYVGEHWHDECIKRGIFTEAQVASIEENPDMMALRTAIRDQVDSLESTKQ